MHKCAWPLFKGEREEDAAIEICAARERCQRLSRHAGLLAPPPLPQALKLAYHDACHLAHAQSITAAPRQLLRSIPNVTLLEIPGQ